MLKLLIVFILCFYSKQIRNDMVPGCNFFKWCVEDIIDEIDVIIVKQRNKICLLEKI